MAHWLLQSNPQRWRIADFLADRGSDELTTWSVTRYRDEVQPGDDFALWRTGRDAGVIALGQVTGLVYEAAGVADEYWQDMEQAERTHWWLPLRLTEVFLDQPVTREELRHDPAFAQAAILRQPFAGNPFRLSDAEWSVILRRHRVEAPGEPKATSAWSLQPGDRIRRRELHTRYGGSWQDGISPCATTPNILLFTDPLSGEQHGYYDLWAPDGSFHYTGRGQRGDQTLTSGNRAVLDHAKEGRALRLFQGARGVVEYIGEFVLDEREPYSWAQAPATGGGPLRRVVRFHLLPVDRPAAASQSGQVGTPYQEQDETTKVSSPTPAAPADPDAIGRGLRAHRRLQNQLSRLVRAAGFAPLRPSAIDPDFDLAWETPEATVVVEVKSCTKANEVRQLRMGIGQVLDYEDTLRARGRVAQPVLYLERAPSDARWAQLAQRHNVRLIWPGTEHELFEHPTSRPPQRGA
jgi:predicted RNA-binding protein with PUA-like domain